MKANHSHLISVAPMMNCTDKHARYLLRLIAPNIRLYTEMVIDQAILRGDPERFLSFNTEEHPLALQLGGSNPANLAACAQIGEAFGYDEVNLNIGCPSSRVVSGNFGACLMKQPELVADCVMQIRAKVKIPVSVKCRIGVDNNESYEHLHSFITTLSQAGCKIFIIHARIALLNGLSAKENREIPLLKYDLVYKIKQDFPQHTIVINGGIKNLSAVQMHLEKVDGVMIGREAYSNPYWLNELQTHFYPHAPSLTRSEVVSLFATYISQQTAKGVRLATMTRHLLGLYRGVAGAAGWRRYISENAHRKDQTYHLLTKALEWVNHV